MADTFQRIDAISNAHVGRHFEDLAHDFFFRQGINLEFGFKIPLGHSRRKDREFDLGASEPAFLIECKSHRWTVGGNVPSAKMTVWNESMYYFHLAPRNFRKVMFVLYDLDARRGLSLAEYYVRNYGHLIPEGIEIIEYNDVTDDACTVIAT